MHVSLRRFILGVAALLIAAAAVQRFSLLAATPPSVTPRPTPGSSRPPSGHGRRRWQPIASPPPPKAGAPQAEGTAAECAKMRLEHLVVVGVAWGTLSAAKQMRWTRLGCDMLLQSPFEADVAATGAVSEVFLQRYRSNHRTALAGREAARRIPRPTNRSAIVVAVAASAANRGLWRVRRAAASHRAGWTTSLSSASSSPRSFGPSAGPLPRHRLSAAAWRLRRQLELRVYIAYDVGDAFFDSRATEAAARVWLEARLVAPLRAAGIATRHALLRFPNPLRKPGPVFNFMMAAAAEDGAEYLYRVNDDTEFVDPWVEPAIRSLRSYSPPNVGVVGPVCAEGNAKILTHDLVHRHHLSIFEFYYPPVLSDWWMDDWITHVYGTRRFTKGPFSVRHHTGAHGQRYAVDNAHKAALRGELQRGRQRIEAWVRSSAAVGR
ncbi:hypothetical protein EMIHUDRAFT_432883 [Emiliania huxleyi CCMP1516]|uniref:Hexosyltransferase n=2 Tax=Emiliania huxleyi TaxID=2903 RepID=A0A0D3IE13_EMIH1|nr:hypothetical protein EMIHUDRAFT_432883 [Emiliania huxleyi CCMP1516]EOD09498.1 hypothetical protein EMIHUDRAFT_432883 [Emiliania huxleyi CCMP1516]|eukprot:XP_005761927.1 hypothetical protein EMIHUDRAFT_432883 [Emiliania huxleyi CCMP1516]